MHSIECDRPHEMITYLMSATELKGVWLNTGRQQPMSAVMALENNTLPDCSMDDTGLSSYTGLDTGAGQASSLFP